MPHPPQAAGQLDGRLPESTHKKRAVFPQPLLTPLQLISQSPRLTIALSSDVSKSALLFLTRHQRKKFATHPKQTPPPCGLPRRSRHVPALRTAIGRGAEIVVADGTEAGRMALAAEDVRCRED